jgi:hypothetical protein
VIFSGESGTGTDFSPSPFVSPSQHHITGVPLSYSLACCSNNRDNGAKPGNFPKKQYSFKNLHHLIERYVKTLLWLVKLIFVLSEQRPGFDPRPVHVTFVLDKEG